MRFLKVVLNGPLQAWGGHTYENYRPTEIFPTKSGMTGLLACVLGIPREDFDEVVKVDDSYIYAVRCISQGKERGLRPLSGRKLVDFHIVKNVRTTLGKTKNEVTYREYLENKQFVAFLRSTELPAYSLDSLGNALRYPVFTPYLGRKCCAISEPLFGGFFEGNSFEDMFATLSGGPIYSECPPEGEKKCGFLNVRDIKTMPRKFISRNCWYYTPSETIQKK